MIRHRNKKTNVDLGGGGEVVSGLGFLAGGNCQLDGKRAKMSGCKSNLQGRPSFGSSALVNTATPGSGMSLAGSG